MTTFSYLLGTIGRALIWFGCVVLLFVGFQLWGTNLEAQAAQSDLTSEFTDLLATVPTVEPVATAVPGATVDPAQPTPEPTPLTEEFVNALYVPEGEAIARITIPNIGVDHAVVEGVSVDDLRKGPGHYMQTALPGQAGNAAIAGHRTTYGAPFHRVDELFPGDEITVQTLQGTFIYKVMDTEGDGNGNVIVDPSATEVLDDYGDNRLTLTACHPKYSAAQRIIIFAELVGEPVQTPPRPEDWTPEAANLADESQTVAQPEPASGDASAQDLAAAADATGAAEGAVDDALASDAGEPPAFAEGETAAAEADFGEGLDGDETARMPAFMWLLAATVIWMTAVFVGRRTSWVPTFVFALIPFGLTLWISFGFLDRALPSY